MADWIIFMELKLLHRQHDLESVIDADVQKKFFGLHLTVDFKNIFLDHSPNLQENVALEEEGKSVGVGWRLLERL